MKELGNSSYKMAIMIDCQHFMMSKTIHNFGC